MNAGLRISAPAKPQRIAAPGSRWIRIGANSPLQKGHYTMKFTHTEHDEFMLPDLILAFAIFERTIPRMVIYCSVPSPLLRFLAGKFCKIAKRYQCRADHTPRACGGRFLHREIAIGILKRGKRKKSRAFQYDFIIGELICLRVILRPKRAAFQLHHTHILAIGEHNNGEPLVGSAGY